MLLSEIQATVEEAAQAIMTLPIEQWGGWVTYLLEAMDDTVVDQGERNQLMNTVLNAIEARVEEGRW